MSRHAAKDNRSRKGSQRNPELDVQRLVNIVQDAIDVGGPFPLSGENLRPKNSAQRAYLNSLKSKTITFGMGPAGTGKTFVAMSYAIEQLASGEASKILVTRPAIEAGGEDLGALPGELKDKFMPYLVPLLEILRKRAAPGTIDYLLHRGRIEATPVGYLRGRSLENTIILVDEAQNLTTEQMKMLLTRVGEGSQIIIDGDPAQSDIRGKSGLVDAVERLADLDQVEVIEFTRADIVRHDIIQAILEKYEKDTP